MGTAYRQTLQTGCTSTLLNYVKIMYGGHCQMYFVYNIL